MYVCVCVYPTLFEASLQTVELILVLLLQRVGVLLPGASLTGQHVVDGPGELLVVPLCIDKQRLALTDESRSIAGSGAPSDSKDRLFDLVLDA